MTALAAGGLARRLARLETVSGAAARARQDARRDAALRLLSDEDLTGLFEWLRRCPQSRQEEECPPHLAAALQSAWERAGGTLPQ